MDLKLHYWQCWQSIVVPGLFQQAMSLFDSLEFGSWYPGVLNNLSIHPVQPTAVTFQSVVISQNTCENSNMVV